MSVRRDDEDFAGERRQSLVDEDRADREDREDDEPGVFTVFERQVITYAWDVRGDSAFHAEQTTIDGVPDSARTVRFSSESWTERAEDDVEPDIDLTEDD